MNELDGVKIYFLANLSRHTKAVNIVRFAPNGKVPCICTVMSMTCYM